MNIRIYEYIIAVAEQKNITRAAEKCYISQPALTQQIKKLEKEFGFALFKKEGKNLIPTAQGEIFLTTARRILQVERETMQRIEELKQSTPKTYRIFADISIRNILIEQIWPKFQQSYPEIKLQILSGDIEQAWEYLEKHLTDVGVFPFQGNCPSTVECICIEQSEFLLVMPQDHPAVPEFLAHGIQPDFLQNETFILNQEFSFFSSVQQKIMDSFHFKPSQVLHSHSMKAILQMVEIGKGVSLFPAFLLPLVPPSCITFSFQPSWNFQYVAAYPKTRRLNVYDELLVSLLTRHYDQFHPGS